MACPTVVATTGTWGAPVSSSSNVAQTASAPPRLDLPFPRGVERIATSTSSARAAFSHSFWKPASLNGFPWPSPFGARQ